MARTEKRGKRERRQTRPTGQPTGPVRDPDEDVDRADQQGKIKPLRPDKAWLRANRVREPED